MSRCFDDAVKRISPCLSERLLSVDDEIKRRCFEVRLRAEAPVMLYAGDGAYFVGTGGRCSRLRSQGVLTAGREDIADTFGRLCGYSLYSHGQDIAHGFVCAGGGHIAGICGTAVVGAQGVTAVKDICGINLRIARENTTAALEVCSKIFSKGLTSVIVSGAPSSGKTTLLRDLARRLSAGLCGGRCMRVCVIDERGELFSMQAGHSPYDTGNGCDVMTGWPKAEAITAAVRSLSPDIIICDEIADSEQAQAVAQGFGCGVCFAVSVHASCRREILMRPAARELLRTGAFEHIVQLRGAGQPCELLEIYDAGELVRMLT